MKYQLEDYQIYGSSIPIYCDNTAAICLTKNLIQYSRTKHTEIKHHLFRDYVQKGVINIQFIDTGHQWADIFTKRLVIERFVQSILSKYIQSILYAIYIKYITKINLLLIKPYTDVFQSTY